MANVWSKVFVERINMLAGQCIQMKLNSQIR